MTIDQIVLTAFSFLTGSLLTAAVLIPHGWRKADAEHARGFDKGRHFPLTTPEWCACKQAKVEERVKQYLSRVDPPTASY